MDDLPKKESEPRPLPIEATVRTPVGSCRSGGCDCPGKILRYDSTSGKNIWQCRKAGVYAI